MTVGGPRRRRPRATKNVDAKGNYIARFLLVGDWRSASGMTSLILRMTRHTFSFKKTFVWDYEEAKVDLHTKLGSSSNGEDGGDTVKLRLQFWEIRRSERGFLLQSSDFRKRFDGYIVCYDITQRETFQFAQHWIRDNLSWCSSNTNDTTPNDTTPTTAGKIRILCGTNLDRAAPTDCNRSRPIPSAEGQSVADQYGMEGFVEASSRTGENTDRLFQEIQNLVVQRVVLPHHDHKAASAAETKKTVEQYWWCCRHLILGLVLSTLVYSWCSATDSIAAMWKNLRWKDGAW